LNYGLYKNARNASWQCLIDFKINALPVMVSAIAKSSGILIIKNTDANLLKAGESGITIIQNNKFYIIYNNIENSKRCRFTIAHELGHIFLGHLMINTSVYRTFANRDDTESEANVFARDLLAPACVLHELQILSATDISNLCDISLEAAGYRAERMRELENRNAWYLHPLERQVHKQFEDFVKSKQAKI
jgi:Zn-dependent peptidase ImmA (M78 family)